MEPLVSVRVTDRTGRPLREVASALGGRARWLSLQEMPPHLVDAFVAVEDRRFWSHPGVDARAIARASLDRLGSGRPRSGASTLTMQLVRLIWPRERDLTAKLSEAVWALRLERSATKEQILEQYLNRAPFGNRLFGVEAAARAYFGRSARDVGLAEAALLAGLPNAPSALDPRRFPERAAARQRQVVARMRKLGKLTSDQAAAASQAVRLVDSPASFRAPHAVDAALAQLRAARVFASSVELTIDANLQSAVEGIVARRSESLRSLGASSAAVVVIDNRDREILALVGSLDYFGRTVGQVNGAYARRQPGSALKPFAYALALDRGLNLSTLLPDVPSAFPEGPRVFRPRNFDGAFRGPVRLRVALASSLNVPAVHLAKYVGVRPLLEKLWELGVAPSDGDAQRYGLGLVLGVAETTLVDLTGAYSSLARGGEWAAPRLLRKLERARGESLPLPPSALRRAFSPEASFLVLDAMADEAARTPTFGAYARLGLPFPLAVKTGTSDKARDLWAVGVTPELTVGVWVGSAEGRSLGEVVAAQHAQPLLVDVVSELYRSAPPAPWPTPEGLVKEELCADSGGRATDACPHRVFEWRAPARAQEALCKVHKRLEIDARTGLLATAACPKASVRLQTFEEWPAELAGWAVAQGRPVPPARSSPLCVAR